MTASISPVLVRLPPCGPQMRLYVYETGGRALTDHPSKPGGTCVKVCACVLSGFAHCVDACVHLLGCDKVCGCTVCTCVCMCVFMHPARTGEESKRGPPQFSLSIILHARHTRSDMPERVSISCVCVFVCLRSCVYPRNAVHYICMCVWLLHIFSTHMRKEADGD